MIRKVNCILIDDEPFALNILEDDLSSFANIQILAKFSSPTDVFHFLDKNEVDLIFLDIQMPEMLGTEFIRRLKKVPMVIFTTAYQQYAVEGFELNAIDYLVKPIRKERLEAALVKVENQLNLINKINDDFSKNFIILNIEYQKVKIYYDEIIYVEGLKDYVKIYLENRLYPLLTRSNLKGMELKLPPTLFARIHNSYVVNIKKVTSYNQAKVLVGNTELPVGSKYNKIGLFNR
jgi:DNA-binding LytR/AlgR family response regulator